MEKYIKRIMNSNKITKSMIDAVRKIRDDKLHKKRINIIKKHGRVVVQEIEGCLNNSGLIYFATCGTLLGLIRENRLLRDDYDMDYGVIIKSSHDWETLAIALNEIGYEKIREFWLDEKITEQTYKHKNGVEIDFFGHFIEDDNLCFYSYDRIPGMNYPSEILWTAYRLNNGKFKGTKKIETDIGMVTVPANAEEYLTYNYNDDWMIPNPKFKANTGKGCHIIYDKFGIIRY